MLPLGQILPESHFLQHLCSFHYISSTENMTKIPEVCPEKSIHTHTKFIFKAFIGNIGQQKCSRKDNIFFVEFSTFSLIKSPENNVMIIQLESVNGTFQLISYSSYHVCCWFSTDCHHLVRMPRSYGRASRSSEPRPPRASGVLTSCLFPSWAPLPQATSLSCSLGWSWARGVFCPPPPLAMS